MKRFLCVLCLTAVTVSLMVGSALAVDATYFLDELGISVTLPNYHTVITRQIEDDDPDLAMYDLSKEDFEAYLRLSNTYLIAWDDVYYGYEIRVTADDYQTVEDLRDFGDDELQVLLGQVQNEYTEQGCTDLCAELYENDDATYFHVSYTADDEGDPVYYEKYTTVKNGKYLVLTMNCYSELDKEMKYQLKRAVDFINYDAMPPADKTSGEGVQDVKDPSAAEPINPSADAEEPFFGDGQELTMYILLAAVVFVAGCGMILGAKMGHRTPKMTEEERRKADPWELK